MTRKKPLTDDIAHLSGNAYVSIRLRPDAGRESDDFTRVKIASPANCDHGFTICSMKDCIGSWSTDWEIYLWRTGGGRKIAETLGIPPHVHQPVQECEAVWFDDDGMKVACDSILFSRDCRQRHGLARYFEPAR